MLQMVLVSISWENKIFGS